MKDNARQLERVNKVLIGLIVLLLTVIVAAAMIFIRSNKPMNQAQKESEQLAKSYADVQSVDKFYWFSREATYFSVTGTTSQGTAVAVIIPQSGDNIQILQQAEGITEAEATVLVKQTHNVAQVSKTSLGVYKDEVVWEVTCEAKDGTLAYYLISFKDGKEVHAIENI